jgi:hypothetical protein
MTNEYISKCVYHEIKDPFCPVFKIGYILDKIEDNEYEKLQMLLKVYSYSTIV